MSDHDPTFLELGRGDNARAIAVRVQAGNSPGLFWLGGFKSDMMGVKAVALAQWAAAHGRACVRFDYSGHGESGDDLVDGSIGRWLEESLAVFETFCRGPQVVIGSSMGAWLALLLSRELNRRAAAQSDRSDSTSDSDAAAAFPPPLRGRDREGGTPETSGQALTPLPNPPPQGGRESAAANGGQRGQDADSPSIAGLVLIAPAVDFTEALMWRKFSAKVRRRIERTGSWERPSAYGEEPYLITRRLIEDGREHLLLGGLIETGCPVRILQGVEDPDVPWRHALDVVSRIARDDVVLTLVKDGDHRLSRPQDIERLIAAVAEFD